MIVYTSDGEVRQCQRLKFSIVLAARPVSGEPTLSSKSSRAPTSELPGYTMDRSMSIASTTSCQATSPRRS